MSQPTDLEVVNVMHKHGGSFVQALAKAAMLADPINHERLKAAFPDYWDEYAELHRLLKGRANADAAKA